MLYNVCNRKPSMPPKIKYTKEDVVKAALGVVEENGLSSLSARSVADRLGSSTAPVYQYYESMDELALDVMKEIKQALVDYASRPYTDRVFLNMGTGIALFAGEHGRLYRAFLMESDSYHDIVNDFYERLETDLVKDGRFVSLSDIERHELLAKMWTFTHGLASLICVGLIKDCSQECIIRTLMDMGTDVIGATMARHQKLGGGAK